MNGDTDNMKVENERAAPDPEGDPEPDPGRPMDQTQARLQTLEQFMTRMEDRVKGIEERISAVECRADIIRNYLTGSQEHYWFRIMEIEANPDAHEPTRIINEVMRTMPSSDGGIPLKTRQEVIEEFGETSESSSQESDYDSDSEDDEPIRKIDLGLSMTEGERSRSMLRGLGIHNHSYKRGKWRMAPYRDSPRRKGHFSGDNSAAKRGGNRGQTTMLGALCSSCPRVSRPEQQISHSAQPSGQIQPISTPATSQQSSASGIVIPPVSTQGAGTQQAFSKGEGTACNVAPAQISAGQGVPTQVLGNQVIYAQGTAHQPSSVQQTSQPSIIVQGTTQQSISVQGTSQHSISVQGAPRQLISLQGTPQQSISVQGTPQQPISVQGTPQQSISVQGTSQQSIPVQGTSLQPTSGTITQPAPLGTATQPVPSTATATQPVPPPAASKPVSAQETTSQQMPTKQQVATPVTSSQSTSTQVTITPVTTTTPISTSQVTTVTTTPTTMATSTPPGFQRLVLSHPRLKLHPLFSFARPRPVVPGVTNCQRPNLDPLRVSVTTATAATTVATTQTTVTSTLGAPTTLASSIATTVTTSLTSQATTTLGTSTTAVTTALTSSTPSRTSRAPVTAYALGKTQPQPTASTSTRPTASISRPQAIGAHRKSGATPGTSASAIREQQQARNRQRNNSTSAAKYQVRRCVFKDPKTRKTCTKSARKECDYCNKFFCKSHRYKTIHCPDYDARLQDCYTHNPEERDQVKPIGEQVKKKNERLGGKAGRCESCPTGKHRKTSRTQCHICRRFICKEHQDKIVRCLEHKNTFVDRSGFFRQAADPSQLNQEYLDSDESVEYMEDVTDFFGAI